MVMGSEQLFPVQALMRAIENIDRRLRKIETSEGALFDGFTPTLSGAWTSTGGAYPSAAYWRDNQNIVYFRGRIQGGAVPSTVFTLPAGYRPFGTRTWATALGDVIEITAAGVVTVLSGASPVSLDGIIYRAYS